MKQGDADERRKLLGKIYEFWQGGGLPKLYIKTGAADQKCTPDGKK